jgi:hypothetical protein
MENNENIDTQLREDIQLLNKNINKLANTINKYMSFPHIVARGIMTGFAGFLGATLVVAIFIAVLSQMEKIPLLSNSNIIIYINDVLEENTKLP